MNTPEMVAENAAFQRDGVPLTPAEYEVIEAARDALAALPGRSVHRLPLLREGLSEGVHLNTIMQSLNIYDQMGVPTAPRRTTTGTPATARRAPASQCGACESVCPQHIEIVSQLERAVKLFE